MLRDKFSGWIKFVIGWALVFGVRLAPFRPPNVEPILATIMPFSKRYKYLGGFFFGFLSIAMFDVAVAQVGSWTWITATVYGLLGVGAYAFFQNREASTKNFLIYGIAGTLIYDAITGVVMGPLLYGQPFIQALTGQIPFTINHLLGTVVFAVALSPAIYKWVILNKRLEFSFVISKLLGGTKRI